MSNGDRLSSASLGDMSDVPSDLLQPLLDVARGQAPDVTRTRGNPDALAQAGQQAEVQPQQIPRLRSAREPAPAASPRSTTSLVQAQASFAARQSQLRPRRGAADNLGSQAFVGEPPPALQQPARPARAGLVRHTEGSDETSQVRRPTPLAAQQRTADDPAEPGLDRLSRQLPRVCQAPIPC